MFFGAITICLLIVHMWFTIPLHIYIGVVTIYSLLLLYGSYTVGSNFFVKVLCSANITEKLIAISFDDGPAEKYTPQVLQILKEQKVPAAFFCIGKCIVKNESLFRQVYEQGHIIGNHSYTHTPLFDLLSSKQMLEDVKMTDMVVKESVGLRPALFRPPYGITTPAMKKMIDMGRYTAIGWNIRSLDTISTNENKLLNKLIRMLQPGAVILLHDTQKITVSVLPHFIQAARNEGYEFVRLDTLLNVKCYA